VVQIKYFIQVYTAALFKNIQLTRLN